jgi:hypothetical protein
VCVSEWVDGRAELVRRRWRERERENVRGTARWTMNVSFADEPVWIEGTRIHGEAMVVLPPAETKEFP